MLNPKKISNLSGSMRSTIPAPIPAKKGGLLDTGDNLSTGLGASSYEAELADNEVRSIIDPKSLKNWKYKELVEILINWINEEIHAERIIVKDIEEDLYDGQVLQKLIEKLTGETLNVPEVASSEEAQREKLNIVLSFANKILKLDSAATCKWSVDSVRTKNIVATLHILIALALHFRAPIRMPENVVIEVITITKKDGGLVRNAISEQMTAEYGYNELGQKREKDAFDTLFDKQNQPTENLQLVIGKIIAFANLHLRKINGQHVKKVTDLQTQFSDGVYLCLLMGLLEGYFVPLYEFHITPTSLEEKVANVSFAFELMEDAGLSPPKARPEDIVNRDLKSTLRVLYEMFLKYKHLN